MRMLRFVSLTIMTCAGVIAVAPVASGGPKLVEVCDTGGCRMVDPTKPTPKKPRPADTGVQIKQEYQGEDLAALEVAALEGDAVAAYKLATVYGRGLVGVEKDREKAISFYSIGAEQGHVDSARGAALSLLYESPPAPEPEDDAEVAPDGGDETLDGGKVEDDAAAGKKIQASAKALPSDKQYSTDSSELQRATRYLYTAANGGDPVAMLELGKLFYSGAVLGKDIARAGTWFEQAANAGSADAQYYIGQMYFRGTGMRQDGYQAIKWTREAARNGSVLGQRALGQLYINGYETIAPDLNEADRWLTAAAQNGDPQSARLLDKLRSGQYMPGGEFTSLLPAGDLVRASDAAMLAIEDARAQLAAGRPLSELGAISWGDEDGDGLSDGETKVVSQPSSDCFEIETGYREGGQWIEQTETHCL